jgi:pimeloyl-ACP methyl ester carboxylesterase
VPTVTIDGANDPLKPGGTGDHAHMFVGLHEHRVVDAGHNLPQQAPQAFADAVLTVRDWNFTPMMSLRSDNGFRAISEGEPR